MNLIQAYIGLGSNLNNPISQIKEAMQSIAQIPEIRDFICSPLYLSKPVGPQDQPDFVNAVMLVSTNLSAQNLLFELQKIENIHGRLRLLRWGARTLDLDILIYGKEIINTPNLIIPHPELANRSFVLYPLADIVNVDFEIPVFGKLIDLIKTCPADDLLKIQE